MRKINYLIGLFLLVGSMSKAQQQRTVIIQQFTVTTNGVTDTVDAMPLVIDNSGNVTVASNKKLSPTQYDATIAEQLSSGVSSWINSYSSPTNQKAFVVASCQDNSGNTFVTGGVRNSAGNGLDIFVIGYDNNGTQIMSGSYNGPSSLTDVGTAICVDNNGIVYVTGASDGLFSGVTDYATIAFDASSGTQLWASRYNYSNMMDVPTGISYDASAHSVYVTGASGSSLLDFDIATVRYMAGPAGGAQIADHRDVYTGAGFDKPFGMVTDASGNMYIVGTTYNGTTSNYDMQVQKLDTSLVTIWSQSYDGFGYDDAGIGIALDSQGNVIVTGASKKANGQEELFVLKYSPAGGITRRYYERRNNVASVGMRVKIAANDDIFIGGQIGTGASQDVVVMVLDSTCKQVGRKVFNASYNLQDKFMDLAVTSNNIYLSARSYNGSTDDNLLITYTYKNFVYTPKTDTVTYSKFTSNNVIIAFHKSAMKMSAVNDRNLIYGNLNTFVADSTCDKISQVLDPDGRNFISARNFIARKTVMLTESDSISDGRLGNKVQIPPFYTSLLIDIPNTLDEVATANAIQSIFGDVSYSQLNDLYEIDWVPGDPHYAADQTSLHPNSIYTGAHINCEPAWDRTKGLDFVKAGVFDSGVDPGHEDLTTFADFDYGPSGYGIGDPQGHGTRVASVIGAHSNNGLGVTGVAGGDNSTQNGVKLYNMKVGDAQLFPWTNIKQALIEGASGTNVTNGKGLHIINCCFGTPQTNNPEMLAAANYINGNSVSFVCSRGNKTPANPISVGGPNVPATLKPKITMNVGASGNDGHYHKAGVNGSSFFTSMDSLGVDFVAPGDKDNVYTATHYQGPNPPWIMGQVSSISDYTFFSGTSASAPHVSGVIALMMSYRNANYSTWDNLAHEDCEALIKRSSTDLTSATYGEAVGYDHNTGWGLINADSALSCLEPQYKIRHIDGSHYNTSVSTQTAIIASNVNLSWNTIASNMPPPGVYQTDIIEVQKAYTYNYSSETYIDAWPLYGPSSGYINVAGINSAVDASEPRNVEIVSATLTNAVTKTYVYKLKQNVQTGAMVNTFVPNTPNNINSAFTLYTIGDPNVGISANEPEVSYFNLYPNPSNGNFTLGFSSKKEAEGKIVITDLMGKVVYARDQNVKNGLNRLNLNITGLSRGIYLVSLSIEDNKALVKKLVIE